MPRLTPVKLERAMGMLQANALPSVIAQPFQRHFVTIEHLRNRLRKNGTALDCRRL